MHSASRGKNYEEKIANMHVHVQLSRAWISPPPATISACHADRTECDRLSFSDQMMRRLLSSSGMTVFNDLGLLHNALSQWTSLTLDNKDLSVNAIGQMLLQLNSVELREICDFRYDS